jgi:hypothetical protein
MALWQIGLVGRRSLTHLELHCSGRNATGELVDSFIQVFLASLTEEDVHKTQAKATQWSKM